jgi:hypothetical protein
MPKKLLQLTLSSTAVASLMAVTQLAAGQHHASQSLSSSPVLCTVNFDLHHYHAPWSAYAVIMVSIVYSMIKKCGTCTARLGQVILIRQYSNVMALMSHSAMPESSSLLVMTTTHPAHHGGQPVGLKSLSL